VKLDLDAPRVASIDVFPKDPIMPRPGMKQQIAVIATYTDGTQRDVTARRSSKAATSKSSKADKTGLVTTLRRGEAPVLVRYEGAYAATTIIVMGDRSGFAWSSRRQQLHRRAVDKKLQRVKMLPSDLCTDEEFIRRVYLDLTGLPPTSTSAGVPGRRRDSRAKARRAGRSLVGSRDYVEHWTNKWADLLQVNRKFLGEEGAGAPQLDQAAVAANKPYDEFAREC
jgi:hypothetical protein